MAGKDQVRQQAAMWQAILMSADLPLTGQILIHGFITSGGEKMSKSLGNTLQVTELLKKVRGIELRWYLGSAHYRSMLEFSTEALQESATAFQRIENFLHRAHEIVGDFNGEVSKEMAAAFDDDLAVPQVLALISESLRDGNSAITSGDKAAIKKASVAIRGALSILGCDPFDSNFARGGADQSAALDGVIKLALAQRDAARARAGAPRRRGPPARRDGCRSRSPA